MVTDCALTKAAGSKMHDAVVGLALLQEDALTVTVLADSASGTGDVRAALADAGHETVIKPRPLRARVPGGFTADEFAIEFTANTVT